MPLKGWFLGDTETDIKAGQMLGLKTAAVSFGIRTVEHIKLMEPDIIIESPSDLVIWLKNLLI